MGIYSRFSRSRRDDGSRFENALKDFVNRPDNKGKCCECLSPSVKYISISFHCLLCSRCGSVHMSILPESVVKSTQYPDDWTKDDIRALMNSGGNKENRAEYNGQRVAFPYDADIDKLEVEKFIKDKYAYGTYMSGGVQEDLLYRNVCKTENGSYEQKEYRASSTRESSAPSLPSKPRPNKNVQPSSGVFFGEEVGTSSNYATPKTALFDGTVDLQPYYDQSTGQVYVDQQQYQQYEQQQQQQQQYLAQQQSLQQQTLQNQQALQNQQIMSMYNQPGVYQSGVQIAPNQPQYNAIVQQQTAMQQQNPQQQFFQQPQQNAQQYNPQQQNNGGFFY